MVVKRVLEDGIGFKKLAAVSLLFISIFYHPVSLSFFLYLYVSVFYQACSLHGNLSG